MFLLFFIFLFFFCVSSSIMGVVSAFKIVINNNVPFFNLTLHPSNQIHPWKVDLWQGHWNSRPHKVNFIVWDMICRWMVNLYALFLLVACGYFYIDPPCLFLKKTNIYHSHINPSLQIKTRARAYEMEKDIYREGLHHSKAMHD